jgi:hypothetical protein
VRLTRKKGERFGTCLDTTDWRTRWSIPIPAFAGGDVGCRFLTADRFVIAAREVSLWQANVPVWRTKLPTPVEFKPGRISSVVRPDEADWDVVSCGDPTTDGERIYLHTHWAKCLGSPGYFYEQEWDDRGAVEILSIHDGSWIRREEVPLGEPPSVGPPVRDECRKSPDGFKLYNNQVYLGLLAITPERLSIDADLSMADRRIIVSMPDDRFAFLELVD